MKINGKEYEFIKSFTNFDMFRKKEGGYIECFDKFDQGEVVSTKKIWEGRIQGC